MLLAQPEETEFHPFAVGHLCVLVHNHAKLLGGDARCAIQKKVGVDALLVSAVHHARRREQSLAGHEPILRSAGVDGVGHGVQQGVEYEAFHVVSTACVAGHEQQRGILVKRHGCSRPLRNGKGIARTTHNAELLGRRFLKIIHSHIEILPLRLSHLHRSRRCINEHRHSCAAQVGEVLPPNHHAVGRHKLQRRFQTVLRRRKRCKTGEEHKQKEEKTAFHTGN